MRLRIRGFLLPASLAGLAPGLWGCPGTLADPAEFADVGGAQLGSDAGAEGGSEGEGGAPACVAADVPTTILQQTCGVAGCHGTTDPEEGLDLASPGVASRLINIPAMEMPALDLIDSMDSQTSVILTKLQASTVPYGSQMPLGEPPLTPQQVACVAAWIESVIADAGPMGAAAAEGGVADSSPVGGDGG